MDWLWTLIIVIVAIWLAGFLFKIGGKLIHLLIVAALVFFILRLFGVL